MYHIGKLLVIVTPLVQISDEIFLSVGLGKTISPLSLPSLWMRVVRQRPTMIYKNSDYSFEKRTGFWENFWSMFTHLSAIMSWPRIKTFY